MRTEENKPEPFPVRKASQDNWEVLLDGKKWLLCESEADARRIARAPLLWHLGPAAGLASELQELADTLKKYRCLFLSRQFEGMAADALKSARSAEESH